MSVCGGGGGGRGGLEGEGVVELLGVKRYGALPSV